MPHKRYKHSKYRKKRPAQMPYNRYKRCERHKGPTPMSHKRYTLRFATPRHATLQKTLHIQIKILKKNSPNAS